MARVPRGYVDDLIGQKINMLTIIKKAEDDYISQNGRHLTKCVCQCECGQLATVSASALRRGKIKSCGCIKKVTAPRAVKNDLTNKRFGKLLVLERSERYVSPSGVPLTKYKCLCDCGNVCFPTYSSLTSGTTKSCGCLNSEMASKNNTKNKPGDRYGLLTLVKKLDINKKTYSSKWLCQCDCGNTIVKTRRQLTTLVYPSCGCSTLTSGEYKIAKYLQDNSFEFVYNKTLSSYIKCDVNIAKCRFDFIILAQNKIMLIIEYDGEQHFMPTMNFGGQESYTKRIVKDDQKNNFCKNANIPLLRIKYTQIDKIKDILQIALSCPEDFLLRFNPLISNSEYYSDRVMPNDIDEFIKQHQTNTKLVEDHLGNTFISIKEMCKHWKVSYSMYNGRINNGFSVKDALTLPLRYEHDNNNIRCEDHLGNKYYSISAMAKHYGLYRKTLTGRLKAGWSLELALTTPAVIGRNQTFKHDKNTPEKL